MKVSVVATVTFDQEIGKRTDQSAREWLTEDIETILDAWENGYTDVKVTNLTILRHERS